MTFRDLLFFTTCSLFASACTIEGFENTSSGNSPRGTVARTAQEAFPNAPVSVPALKREEILSACVRAAECQVGQPNGNNGSISESDAYALIVLCADDLQFSAERAIPRSKWTNFASAVDVWTNCVQGATTCEGVRACDVDRKGVSCQEDGCLGPADWQQTSCEGNIAKVQSKSGTFIRDCALAHATCDAESATGCTDRPYTACPEDPDKADRCDGDIRLGCDGLEQVSYHDCRRMGGTCGKTSEGKMDCIYPNTTADCNSREQAFPTCKDGVVSMCITGARIEVSTKLCQEKDKAE